MTAPDTVAGHTAGPWRADAVNDWAVWAPDCKVAVTIQVGQADFYRDPDKAERIANARLIAAAPDLLAALQAIMPTPLCGESWGLPDDESVQIATSFGKIKAARAAIAKATAARSNDMEGEGRDNEDQ